LPTPDQLRAAQKSILLMPPEKCIVNPYVGGLAIADKLLEQIGIDIVTEIELLEMDFAGCALGTVTGPTLPNSAIVVRGGINTPALVANGTGVHPTTGLIGISVESAAGKTAAELAATLPNNQVGIATVGNVRALGGDVVPTPGKSLNHATLTGLDAPTASQLFQPPVPNPAKVPGNAAPR
jgi:hypothetical protein